MLKYCFRVLERFLCLGYRAVIDVKIIDLSQQGEFISFIPIMFIRCRCKKILPDKFPAVYIYLQKCV